MYLDSAGIVANFKTESPQVYMEESEIVWTNDEVIYIQSQSTETYEEFPMHTSELRIRINALNKGMRTHTHTHNKHL